MPLDAKCHDRPVSIGGDRWGTRQQRHVIYATAFIPHSVYARSFRHIGQLLGRPEFSDQNVLIYDGAHHTICRDRYGLDMVSGTRMYPPG